MVDVDNRADIREFLATRRAKISPDEAGLPTSGRRRVPGLRREEVAVLAGVSTDWYIRLERGNIAEVSDDVLHAVARALRLDEAERAHLFDLARAARPGRGPRRPPKTRIRPSVQWMLDSMTSAAAFVRNARQDFVAGNQLAYALYSPLYPDPLRPEPSYPVNFVRFCFLDARAQEFYPDWDWMADSAVNLLRTDAGRNPYDRGISDLVGELSTRSEDFRVRWAKHNVRLHYTGTKRFHHPVVGDIEVSYQTMPLPADPGLVLTIYSPEPGTPSADAMTLLATWATTDLRDDTPPTAGADQATRDAPDNRT